jgi:epoxyqueuosine reductase
MDDSLTPSSMIKAEARRLGFDGCGISHAELLVEDQTHLYNWLSKGFHGNMGYMEQHAAMRVDPAKLLEGTKSVISVLLNYFPEKTQRHADAPVVSKYAYGKDYHDIIRNKLNHLLGYIGENISPCKGRAFVDSAPILDRAWAARSGLGWIGKNSNLISPDKGSFFFIGTLLVNIPLLYDKPITDFCGDCNRCILACPTGAITGPKVIDARRCISYLTIENREPIDPTFQKHFQNLVFGCDICQDVCPWNRKSVPHQVDELKPLSGILEMTKEEWHHLDEPGYRKIFTGSAIKRAKYEGLKRNLEYLGRTKQQ